ncbi:hypothetical protein Nmel_012523 [Mimus melanotis]
MSSKCQASSLKQPDTRAMKPKGEEEEDTWSSTLATLKTAPKEKPPATIDGQCPLSTERGARVYEDYDCTLNQTNISANNNKFYIIQLLEHNGAYSVWSRWGRVGEVGRTNLLPCASLEAAKKDFEKKFREKTKNSWATRENFIAQPGKYTLIEREGEVGLTSAGVGGCPQHVKKMPLGKLSKQQIVRGFEALEELEAALKEKPPQTTCLEELSSCFYTIIPHNFGRARPPTINSPDLLHAKKDMLLLIQTYVTQTGHKLRILNIWQVARNGEDERFKAHDLLEHRRLLWHGTNVAVVAAILKSGLRIMPHSGGRVGKGIYFASENSKSASYVGRTSENVGIMFLSEVALGKPYCITCDDPTLCQPPAGYDSVLACGRTEPDPAQGEEVLLDGKKVLVCQGKPIPMPAYKDSYFSQSEYLIYQESQCRIRYLVQLCF